VAQLIEELEDLIDQTVTIPTVPTTLLEIDGIVNDPDGSAAAAAEVVAKDPAIATKVLRLANSSIYALKHSVTDIGHAVSILGLKVLKNLVVQATVLDTFQGDQYGSIFDAPWLWDHSVKAGCAAREIAIHAPIEFPLDPEEAYTAGLLHDVGKILLFENARSDYLKAIESSEKKKLPIFATEREVFGFSHAHVGAVLAKKWKLGEILCSAIRHHHMPSKDPNEWAVGCLVHAANGIAHEAAERKASYIGHELRPEAKSLLKLSAETLEMITEKTAEASLDVF